MGKEIERKFLVSSNDYRELATDKVEIKQAYLSRAPQTTVRVRLWGTRGFLTIKSRNRGMERDEWEYEIPAADATQMAAMAGGWTVEKTRYIVPAGEVRWEVDEFAGRHPGLVVAEVELSHTGQQVPLPSWIGREVTGDPAYYNSNL